MRKLLLLTILVLMLPATLASSQPEIQIESINPQPSSPGDTVKVHLVAQNQGSTGSTYQSPTVETSENISILGRTSLKESFYLCGGCQKVATFYLKISEDTTSGSYPIEFHLTSEETGIVENTVIEVDGKPNPIVSAKDIQVNQGGETRFDLTITNRGTDTSSETILTLGNPYMSFNPSKVYLGRLEPGETARKNVKLSAGEELDKGTATINADFEYRDETENIRKNSTISAQILPNAEITVSQIRAEDAYIGSKTRVMIELENTGPGEAEKLSSELSCENAEVQNSKAFAGSLDSEESVPTVYQVKPNSNEVKCTVKTSYVDSKEEHTNQSFEINASRKRTDMLPLLGGLAVLLVAGFYYWRKRDEE